MDRARLLDCFVASLLAMTVERGAPATAIPLTEIEARPTIGHAAT
jgi:hypothetical protein